jgi:cytochrome oxidase Cu insertion factor (SCO1/SenC/PrrC family)
MGHRRLLLALALSGLALVAIAASLIGLTRHPAATAGPAPSLFGGRRPPGVPARPFVLRDQRGRTVRLAALRGRPVVLLFTCTTCGQSAPLAAEQVRAALAQVPGAAGLAVSTGPGADTPARVRRFAQRVGLRVPYLTGAPARLRAVWRDYGVDRGAVSVVVLDRAGVQRVGFGATDDLTPEGLAHDLRVLRRG